MIIKTFNYVEKTLKSDSAIEAKYLPKINAKSTDEVGFVANVYALATSKHYLLFSDNVKNSNSVDKSLYEFPIIADWDADELPEVPVEEEKKGSVDNMIVL
jgi:hypothetical protein